jgi:hypothetical protein
VRHASPFQNAWSPGHSAHPPSAREFPPTPLDGALQVA